MQTNWNSLIEFERTHIYYNVPPADPPRGIVIRTGCLPIVFSAPHSCQHKRGGTWKQEDEYTAAIAEWLHQTTGAHAVYLTHQIDPDPHDDGAGNIYKQTLAALAAKTPVALVVDLHGIRGSRAFGVGLGTMNGVTCPQYEPHIIQAFERAGFQENAAYLDRLVVNHPHYTGGLRLPTVTRFVHEVLKLPAVQIELNAWLRVLERLPHSTNALNNSAPHFYADRRRFQRVMSALAELTQLVK